MNPRILAVSDVFKISAFVFLGDFVRLCQCS